MDNNYIQLLNGILKIVQEKSIALGAFLLWGWTT